MIGLDEPGWWRRNRWALLALLPVLGIALYSPGKNAYDRYLRVTPVNAVAAGADGWVRYHDARLRLIELVAPAEIPTFGSRRFELPPGVRVWRGTFEVDSAKSGERLAGCDIALEDSEGRTYDDSPLELIGARLPLSSCAPAGGQPAPTGPYEVQEYFAVPRSAEPVAVRVWLSTRLPSYARLTKG